MPALIINTLYPRPLYTSSSGGSSQASATMLTVSSSSSATSFSSTLLDSFCQLVFLDVQNANVIVTFDGSTPSYLSKGHLMASGTNYTWQPATLTNAKFALTTSATTGYIYVSQFAP